MAHSSAAVKVGLVVVLALATLAALAYFFFGRSVGGYPVDVTFNNAQGITEQADVHLAGVKIGAVQKIRLNEASRPVLRLIIRPEHNIPLGSTFSISSGGLLGELGVMITPPVQTADGFIPRSPHDPPVIQGKDLASLDDLKEQLAVLGKGSETIMNNLKIASGNIAAISNDPVLRGALSNVARNAERMSAQGVLATSDARGTVAGIRRSVNQLLTAVESEIPTLQTALRNVEQTTRQGQPIAADARAAIVSARGMLDDIRATNEFIRETLDMTLEEAQLGPAMNQTMKNLTAASDDLKVVAANARKISEDLVGTDAASTRVGAVVSEVSAMAGKANQLLERITGVAESADRRRGRLVSAKGQVDVIERLGNDTRFRADTNLAITRGGDAAVILGLTDVGEGNRLNLQYSTPMSQRTRLRYGFVASKLGVGLDWNLYGNPVTPLVANPTGARSLSVNLYDPNNIQMDLYARHQMNDKLGLMAGIEDVFHNSYPMIGLTYRP